MLRWFAVFAIALFFSIAEIEGELHALTALSAKASSCIHHVPATPIELSDNAFTPVPDRRAQAHQPRLLGLGSYRNGMFLHFPSLLCLQFEPR
jgi:hypothetical protein